MMRMRINAGFQLAKFPGVSLLVAATKVGFYDAITRDSSASKNRKFQFNLNGPGAVVSLLPSQKLSADFSAYWTNGYTVQKQLPTSAILNPTVASNATNRVERSKAKALDTNISLYWKTSYQFGMVLAAGQRKIDYSSKYYNCDDGCELLDANKIEHSDSNTYFYIGIRGSHL